MIVYGVLARGGAEAGEIGEIGTPSIMHTRCGALPALKRRQGSRNRHTRSVIFAAVLDQDPGRPRASAAGAFATGASCDEPGKRAPWRAGTALHNPAGASTVLRCICWCDMSIAAVMRWDRARVSTRNGAFPEEHSRRTVLLLAVSTHARERDLSSYTVVSRRRALCDLPTRKPNSRTYQVLAVAFTRKTGFCGRLPLR